MSLSWGLSVYINVHIKQSDSNCGSRGHTAVPDSNTCFCLPREMTDFWGVFWLLCPSAAPYPHSPWAPTVTVLAFAALQRTPLQVPPGQVQPACPVRLRNWPPSPDPWLLPPSTALCSSLSLLCPHRSTPKWPPKNGLSPRPQVTMATGRIQGLFLPQNSNHFPMLMPSFTPLVQSPPEAPCYTPGRS